MSCGYCMARSDRAEDLSLMHDDAQGVGLAIAHLLATGRRRIAHITGPERHLATRERSHATIAALRLNKPAMRKPPAPNKSSHAVPNIVCSLKPNRSPIATSHRLPARTAWPCLRRT